MWRLGIDLFDGSRPERFADVMRSIGKQRHAAVAFDQGDDGRLVLGARAGASGSSDARFPPTYVSSTSTMPRA